MFCTSKYKTTWPTETHLHRNMISQLLRKFQGVPELLWHEQSCICVAFSLYQQPDFIPSRFSCCFLLKHSQMNSFSVDTLPITLDWVAGVNIIIFRKQAEDSDANQCQKFTFVCMLQATLFPLTNPFSYGVSSGIHQVR